MKRLLTLMLLIGLMFAVMTLIFDGFVASAKDPTADPDSLINMLDPENAPRVVTPAHKGLMGLTEEGLPGMKGVAAGGLWENPDSLINTLDPENAVARIPKGTTIGVMREDPDSLIYTISPFSVAE